MQPSVNGYGTNKMGRQMRKPFPAFYTEFVPCDGGLQHATGETLSAEAEIDCQPLRAKT